MPAGLHDPPHDAPLPQLGAAETPDHAVHFYDEDAGLVRVLASFAGEALQAGGAVLAIATAPHLRDVQAVLERQGVDVSRLLRSGKLVTAEAEEALAGFMVGGAPDAGRFRGVVEPLVARAGAASGRGELRAFGELVNVLWQRGDRAATLRVEELWDELIHARPLSLLCAYRLDGFAGAEHTPAFRDVSALHGAVVPSTRYLELAPQERRRHVADLEQRARALEAEVERRRRVEQERARLFAAERAARAEAELICRLTGAANRAETLEQVYAVALDGVAAALGVERASILLLDSDGVMRFKAWRGLGDAYRAAVEGHSPWRPEDRAPAPVLCEDVHEDGRVAGLRAVLAREGIGALGFFPLCARGRLLGKLMVYHPRPHPFTRAEKRLASTIADQIAFAVDRTLAAAERERLLGIVGHDLRNPLNAITMSAGAFLKHEGVEDGVARAMRRIVASAGRIERLIRQLLEFAQARHRAGFPVHALAGDLSQIAQGVVDELQAAWPDRRLVLEVEGDTAGTWDPDLLGEVFSNLVGNALQHGDGGAVTVRVRAAGTEVLAEVHNGGRPIPPDVLPHLFDPFRRGRAGAARSHGVGLGLFITREIVRAHRGAIEARSSAAAGTTVAVRLPRG